MTFDLWMLLATGLWTLAVPQIYAAGRIMTPGGLKWAFGNRDEPLPVAPWVTRAIRAHQNLTENLGLFTILILIAHVAGKANSATALGAEMFFISRVWHTALYTGGVTFLHLRSLVYTIALVGEILIAVQLFH